MMPRQGQRVLREQTRNFIAENPSQVVLTRSTETPDGAGGTTKGSPTPLTAQKMRIVLQAANESREIRTSSGEMLKPTAVLIAEYNADVQRGDVLTINGVRHEVAWVRNLGYEISADVVAR
jgi:hypothetical protein